MESFKISIVKKFFAVSFGLVCLVKTAYCADQMLSVKQQHIEQPNILLFLVDDMGWQDSSLVLTKEVTPENFHFRTPNLERLAKQGMKFTQAYSHAVCTPSRVSLMTGQNPARHHVTNWTKSAKSDHSGSWGPNASPKNWRLEGIQKDDITLPKLLQQAGYYTIHIGKAHFGAIDTSGADPRNLGFDVNIAGHAAGAPASFYGELDFGNKLPVVDNYPQGVPGLEKYHQKDVHLTDVLTIEAKQAIEAATQTGKPFFVNMAHYAIHTPIEAHKRFIKHYQQRTYQGTDIDIPDVEEKYASMVEGMDDSLGELMNYLNELGIAENTLIVFTSDNGGLSGHTRQTTPRGTELNTHNWPLQSGKGAAYEGGTRVPFVVAWGKPNSENKLQQKLPVAIDKASEQTIIIEDLFPTLLNIANASIPNGYPVDGINTRSYWQGNKKEEQRTLYFHYPHIWGPHGPGYEPHSAMRKGDWKVIYYYNSRTWELYDLANDIGEQFNLAQSNSELLASLAKKLKTGLEEKGAQWPVNRVTNKVEPIRLP